ncbi:MAG TPA: hypothetical protein VG652_07405 [Gaiellaceae bacterium]|nr:hypothetical protein [Gaiellaceae bacterium]
MPRLKLRGGSITKAMLLAFAALAIGSIFATTQNSQASSKVAPNNTAPPTISGTTQAGSTLTATNGTFSGTTPLTYSYVWSRCDATGGSCSTISGATNNTFALQQVDVGNTLRVKVTATNSDGSDNATSVPTAVVTAAPATTTTTTTTTTPTTAGCPSGSGTIAIADLSSPAHLSIGQQTITPGVVTPSTSSLQAHFRVTACGGRPVQGALVYATAVPFNQYSVPPEGTTAADGTVTLSMNQGAGFPASRQQELLVMFVRARKSGEDLDGGVSARVLVSFPVSLKK